MGSFLFNYYNLRSVLKMSLTAYFVVICALICSVNSLGDEDVRCVATSCDNAECTAVPSRCNSSDPSSGLFMLSPDVCNCCDYCLANLAEGEACSIGDPSNARHSSICGPGLTCYTTGDNTDGTCQIMTTECMLKQKDYDIRRQLGTLGSMETRATCDDDGLYGNYKCIPGQTCHCLHSNGTRIFGEAPYSTLSDYMTCECSRAYYDAVEILGRELNPHEHFRCSSDGSYDRVQCINDQCLCVDALDGAPTFPDANLVPLETVTTDTLSCYTNTEPGNYFNKCELEFREVRRQVEALMNETTYSLMLGWQYPSCDLDGTYAPVQQNKTHKYCVDKDGVQLTEPLLKTDPDVTELLANMDCKCSRAALVMTTIEKPTCLANGNYNPLQCRRGWCRCVNQNGDQVCEDENCEIEEYNQTNFSCS